MDKFYKSTASMDPMEVLCFLKYIFDGLNIVFFVWHGFDIRMQRARYLEKDTEMEVAHSEAVAAGETEVS